MRNTKGSTNKSGARSAPGIFSRVVITNTSLTSGHPSLSTHSSSVQNSNDNDYDYDHSCEEDADENESDDDDDKAKKQ